MKRIIFYLFIAILAFGCNKKAIPYNNPVPKHDSFIFSSKFVNEDRVITVWTPPIYEESKSSLPVLYMPDGGVKEDFPHIANTLAKLIAKNKIPPYNLVGIENTERGRDLTGESKIKEHEKYEIPMTDGAKNFRAFITEELIPEIDKRYRTTNQKRIIGESLAGLFVMETFLLKPESFDFYIAMDPSLWWNGGHLVNNSNELLNNLPNKLTKLWFAGSGAEDIRKHTNQLSDILANNQLANLKWKYSEESKEKHNTIFRATKDKAMIWIMNENE